MLGSGFRKGLEFSGIGFTDAKFPDIFTPYWDMGFRV